MELLPSVTYHVVSSISVIAPQMMPTVLQNVPLDNLRYAMSDWLASRTISNKRCDLDKLIISYFNLDFHCYGRMFDYQCIPALLSHYASVFDDYILDVDKPEWLFWGYQDVNFSTMFQFRPYYMETYNPYIDLFIENIKGESPKNVNTYSFTLQSEMPSWWNFDNGKVLYQRILSDKQRENIEIVSNITNALCPSFHSVVTKDVLITDYSKCGDMQCVWIWDLLKRDDLRFDAQWFQHIVDKNPDMKDEIRILKAVYDDAMNQGVRISPYNMGVSLGENRCPVIVW